MTHASLFDIASRLVVIRNGNGEAMKIMFRSPDNEWIEQPIRGSFAKEWAAFGEEYQNAVAREREIITGKPAVKA